MNRQSKLLDEATEQETFCFFIQGWKVCPVRRGLRFVWSGGYITALHNFLRRGMEGRAGFFFLMNDRKQHKAVSEEVQTGR